jgi:hypothetical protein
METNFHLAPPPRTVDGFAVVPIDIQTINARFVFDAATSTASADATIAYTVGPTGGNPIFDLRQTITAAWLDGVPFAPAALAHHGFGSGAFTDLRVIEAVQAAGSTHTLRVQYTLAAPNSQLGGSYLPALDWSAGPRLRFVFGLSDLNRARYAEAWLPANLIFDQFAIALEIELVNTGVAHSVVTNAAVTVLGTNHWQLTFPQRFTALSPMLEVRATDTLVRLDDSVTLPVSGQTVALEGWKPTGSAVNLGTSLDALKTHLSDNESDYGPYNHGNRYVAFFNGSGGMEYEGGTTTSTGALAHEVFHSWFARGLKPASQADGWWDEGFTSFRDAGADDPEPFDFTAAPILLCSRDPWQRNTPGNSYSDGARFWRGMAALLGVGQLETAMRQLYERHRGEPVSSAMIEEFLLSRSGMPFLVDAFHRFVYGLANPAPAPDLWLRDAIGDSGDDDWAGAFWDSPDLWVRNADDGGTAHQQPEYGQDNWFYARVRNKPGAGTAEHFMVSFHARGFAGTEFRYPADFLPCIAARAEFSLAPGDTRIVKARWPRSLVPTAGAHTCLLASVITRSGHPGGDRHVWEDNSLAQKNMTVVDLQPGIFIIIPIVISNYYSVPDDNFTIELIRDRNSASVDAALVHNAQRLFHGSNTPDPERFTPFKAASGKVPGKIMELECGGRLSSDGHSEHGKLLTSLRPAAIEARFPKSWRTALGDGPMTALPIRLKAGDQTVVGLQLTVPSEAKPGARIKIHFVQRNNRTGKIIGGVGVCINVTAPTFHANQKQSD